MKPGFDKSNITPEQIRDKIRPMLAQLRKAEAELGNMRVLEAKEFESSIKLNEFVPQVGSKKLKLPNIAIAELPSTKPDGACDPLSPTTQQVARENWDRVFGVMSAAKKWKERWESNKISQSDGIIKRNNVTKSQILELRKTLLLLNRKKFLSERDKILMAAISEKLQKLDTKFVQNQQQLN
ncbi:mutL [Acrasis kona]|uniref:MutL n=1 Tax=Acrasis kona TaxID=1008807 RepID=A0AAW2ZF00_9EUKA